LQRTGLRIEQMDVIELNEAFAAQRWPCCARSVWRTTTRA